MRTLIILCLISSPAMAQCFAGFGFGQNKNISGSSVWHDGGGIGTKLHIGCLYPVDDNISLGISYLHLSQIDVGKP